MLFRHGLRAALRTPGRSALSFLLVLLIAALLTLALGLTEQLSRALQDCGEQYASIAVAEYISGEAAPDPAQAAEKASALAALPLPAGARGWAPERQAQGWFKDREANINLSAVKDLAVLRVRTAENAAAIPSHNFGVIHNTSGILTVSASVEEALFSTRDVAGEYVEVAAEGLEPGREYWIAGRWFNGFSLANFLQPLEVPAPLPVSEDAEGADFRALAEVFRARGSSFVVRSAEKLEDYFPFQQGLLRIEKGRGFTEAEETGGARVCLLSTKAAELTGLSVGDRATLCLASRENCPVLESLGLDGPDAEAEYEIVGLFTAADEWRDSAFIPVPAEPDMTVNHASATLGQFSLENEAAEGFALALEPLLPPGVRLTVYDQGYSQAARPLRAMLRTVRLIALAALLAGLGFLLLTGWLWVSRQRGAGLTLARLGVGPGGTAVWYLSGMLCVALPAAALGTWLGRKAAERVALRLAAALDAGSALDLRYSTGKLALARGGVSLAETGFSPALPFITAAAVILLLLFFIFLLALGTRPRLGRRARSAGGGRSRNRTRSLTGGAAKYALLSLERGGFRSLVGLLAPLVGALLLTVLAASLTGYRAELDTLQTDSTVRGYCTDLYGRKTQGLLLNDEDLEALAALEGCVEYAKTATWDAFIYVGHGDAEGALVIDRLPKLPMSELGVSLAKQDYADAPHMILTTELTMAPQFLYSASPEVTYWAGESEEEGVSYYLSRDVEGAITMPAELFLEYMEAYGDGALDRIAEKQGQDLRLAWTYYLLPNYCAVSTAFMEEHGLSLGDDFLVAYDPQKEFIRVKRMRISACYVKPGGRDNIYLYSFTDDPQWRWQRPDSAVYGFSAAALPEAKDGLKELGFTEVGDANRARKPFALEDGVFLAAKSSLEQRLWYMERLFPLLTALTLLLAPLTAWFLQRGRRRELWLMHCQGATGLRTFWSVTAEQLLLAPVGAALGLALSRALGMADAAGSRRALLFLLLWLAAAFAAGLAGVLRKRKV